MKMQPTSMDFNSDNNEYSSKFDQQQVYIKFRTQN
jgi:hypothetical protein